jgi:ribonuclease Z
MNVIPLGTSSGRPTLSRHVSALAVSGEGEWWLCDCGESAQTRILRAGLSFHKLSGIFITHLHGDHFNGLPGLLSTMALERRERPLALVGPPGIGEYLDLLSQLRIIYYNYPLELRELRGVDFAERAELEVYASARYTVVARPLDHRIFALGYRIEERTRPGRFNLERALELGVPEGPLFGRLQAGGEVRLEDGRTVRSSDVLGPPRPGKSVAYCLDTRPCASSLALARGADLLVHEATYTSELEDEARAYGHSTAAQAAQTALQAGARRLLLTHFSSRYPDPTPLLEEARAIFPDALLAQELAPVEV